MHGDHITNPTAKTFVQENMQLEWGRWLAAWLLLWTATAELFRPPRFIGHHDALAATHSLHSCHLSEHHPFKDARRRKSFSALRSLLRYRGGAHQSGLGSTYKIQVELPDGRKRPVTLAGDAPLPELNRVIQRMLKTLPQAQQQGLQVQVVGSASSLPLSTLKDSTEPQYSNIQSFFEYMVPDLQTQREFVVKVHALAAGPPFTATAATSTKAKTVTLQDLQQREDSTAMMRIKHQKASKHRQVVVSPQVTPVLHAVYKTGGVAVLLGYVDTPAATDAEKKNEPEGTDKLDSRSSARSRRARSSRRVVTLQDLQREEPAAGAPSETIHVQAAVTITRDMLPAVSTGAEGSSANFIEELKQRLLPADVWQRLSALLPTETPRRLQPVGLLIRNPSLTTRSPSSTEQGLSNGGWDPVACLSLLTVAEHLQNNATVLLTLTDPTAPPSSSSSGGARRRRAVATMRVSNDFAVEAFMASRQAWQLQLNQSFVGPSAVVDAASSSSASSALSASSRRRASRQSPSANEETAETRQRRQSLRLRHPVYLNRQQGVVVDVDALLFAVPVAIALEQPSSSAVQTAINFVHVFPSRDDRAASPRVAAEAERYAQKLIRKVVAGGRTEVDRDTWQRLYDMELWLYWLEQRWLSAAVLQGFIKDLLSHADGAARGATARRRLATSQVALALELLVQRWDASSMRSTATTGNNDDEDVEEDEE